MTMRLIPNAAAMSEFVGGFKGDCGETAEISALHVVDPNKYPLDVAELEKVVRRDRQRHWAGHGGAESLDGIVKDLEYEGVPHTSYGYSEPPRFDWRAILRQWGGVKPIIFEYALASRLPGDEPGVHYHFNACLGWDPEAGIGVFADGDNEAVRQGRSGAAGLVRYTLADLEAARVCGLLVIERALGAAPMALAVPDGWTDDGSTLKGPNGVPVVRGFREYLLHRPTTWPEWNWPLSPETAVDQLELGNPALGGGMQQFFRGAVLEWRPENAAKDVGPVGVFEMRTGQEIIAARGALSAAATQRHSDAATISAQQQQIAALQSQLDNQPPRG